MFQRMPHRFLPVSALIAASLVASPVVALAKPAADQGAAAAREAKAATTALAPAEAINGVPMVTIFVDESEEAIAKANAGDDQQRFGTYDEMIESSDHSTRCPGGVSIVVPDGYEGEFGEATVPEGVAELKYIRGRGNSSWEMGVGARRPYKIAFKKKQGLLGMSAAKDWALLTGGWDPTLLKNRLSMWLAQQTGMQYTPKMVSVDVTMVRTNGDEEISREYVGSYCLAELVELKKGRLAIDELDEDVTAESGEDVANITGGHLLSLYSETQNGDEPESACFTVDSGAAFVHKSPEFESEDLTEGQQRQRAYIRDYVSELDKLIVGSEHIDGAAHDAIAEKMDLVSAADYWWIQEVSANSDAYNTDSTFLYKPRNGKLCWGPLWDMDFAYEWSYTKLTMGFCNTSMPWLDALRKNDAAFVELLKERWNDPETGMNAKLAEVVKPGGVLDSYKGSIAASWDADRVAAIECGSVNEDDPRLDEMCEQLRQWIEMRRTWINEHLDDLGRTTFKVDFVADGKLVDSVELAGNDYADLMPDAPEREGYRFKGWLREDGETDYDFSRRILSDTVFEAVYEAEEDENASEQTNTEQGEDPINGEDTQKENTDDTVVDSDVANCISAKLEAANGGNIALINDEYVAMGLSSKSNAAVMAGLKFNIDGLTNRVEGIFASTPSIADYKVEQANDQLSINKSINVAGEFTCGANVELGASIKAEGDIRLFGSNFNSNARENVVYSAQGDIYVTSDNVNASGFYYAPNGTVYFLGQWNNLNNTCVIAKDICFRESLAKVNPNDKWGDLKAYSMSR